MDTLKSVWSMSLAEFRNAIVSRSTPGCGAAAAATADMGLALVMKGLKISQSHERDARRVELIERAEALLGKLGAYADEDVRAFETYMAAMQHPSCSEIEARQRHQAIGRAAIQANRVPLVTAEVCLEALAVAVAALPLVTTHLRSDVTAGGLLLHSGLSSALLNVDANLSSLHDASQQDAAAHARHRLQQDADRKILWLKAPDDNVCG